MDKNNRKRKENFRIFLQLINKKKYRTDFDLEGSCNYALNLITKNKDLKFCERVMSKLRESRVEFRRGSAGGGNQLRQPYLKKIMGDKEYKKYPEIEHIHFFSFYIGNYPDLSEDKIFSLYNVFN